MTIAPLIESVSESEHTLGCRSRSVDRSCPLRFEYLVRNFQLLEFPDPDPPEMADFRGLASEPTMDTFEPAGEEGEDRLSDLKLSCGHRYMDEYRTVSCGSYSAGPEPVDVDEADR